MRRLFWLSAGAVLGVAGYRRVTRLARTVGAAARPAAAPGNAWTDGAARFARDVRDGMELYADRHPGLTGRTLEGQQARVRRPDDEGQGRAHPGTDNAKDRR